MKKKVEQSKNSTKIDIDTNQKTMLEYNVFIHDKIVYIQKIIQNTVLSINQYKKYEIFSNSDVILCISTLTELYEKCKLLLQKLSHIPSPRVDENTPITSLSPAQAEIIEQLQQIVDRLSIIVSGFGTLTLEDLFFISFGSELANKKWSEPIWDDKYQLLLKYLRPIGYKTNYWKNKTKPKDLVVVPTSSSTILYCSNKITDTTTVIETSNQFECYDLDTNVKSVYVKIYGVRLVVHSEKTQKTLIINCLVDNIVLDCLTNTYIDYQKYMSLNQVVALTNVDMDIMKRMIDTFTLKDVLVYGIGDVLKKYNSIMTEVQYIKNTKLDLIIKKFLDMDIVSQRDMLINLLIYNKEDDIQYITYLLYNLITTPNVSLSNNGNGGSAISASDSMEQMLIYESFPWKIKLYFKETMKNTIKYTKEMIHKYDVNRVSLEQQIYVMKVPENVKEKAVLKLKEIKGKPDDSGNKAKQYLEGLLKIPFGVYREEPILKRVRNINAGFIEWINSLPPIVKSHVPISMKDKYTTIEMLQTMQRVATYINTQVPGEYLALLKSMNTKQLNGAIVWTNNVYKSAGIAKHTPTTKTKEEKIQALQEFVAEFSDTTTLIGLYDISVDGSNLVKSLNSLDTTRQSIFDIKNSLDEVTEILDASIHGHKHAKSQILKIIGQWMNGEQSGYCFGFEGSPGIGKTSLAKKGLAHCLKDGATPRPFAFIALGGSCNGSTLEGHSYTYVNSTWGRIADILMDTKCMNPIIYIDELDKVSKTEQGKEIIGILTHLIDTTQNDVFQDKYFSGIDLDLSKALFIFSYNDPAQIDRILLDRIHRIKFDNLSLDEKIVIVRKYILPEINRKMGFQNTVELSDDIIEYLITTYTFESGVRKLKEVLFDLFGEINIEMLKCDDSTSIPIPIVLTQTDIEEKYLKKYEAMNDKKIHDFNEVGVINGLWASMYGKGGVIPIQTMFYPSNNFLELKLTGMQGDVMKESMNVAKSLAWQLLETHEQEGLIRRFEKSKCQGLHIHCPDGAVSKDGPSAGTAITLAILSLFLNNPIKYDVAITGEITLQGNVTEIGGLEDKIIGGIKAGVKTFLYPSRNKKEFTKFWDKYGNKKIVEGIQFHAVTTIHDTFPHIFSVSL